jgi:hypothetical protein
MLKRIYIDNFRCFSNFEMTFQPVNLLLGVNGSEKTTLFDGIRYLQRLIGNDTPLPKLVRPRDLSWLSKNHRQHFEVDVEGNNGLYQYKLIVEQDPARSRSRIRAEHLIFDGKPLIRFKEDGNVRLYRDDHSEGPEFPFDWTRSPIASIPVRHDNTKLAWFREYIHRRFFVVQIIPQIMRAAADIVPDEAGLSAFGGNFVSWYQEIS